MAAEPAVLGKNRVGHEVGGKHGVNGAGRACGVKDVKQICTGEAFQG